MKLELVFRRCHGLIISHAIFYLFAVHRCSAKVLKDYERLLHFKRKFIWTKTMDAAEHIENRKFSAIEQSTKATILNEINRQGNGTKTLW